MISRGPFQLQPLCDSDLESMVGLNYAFAHPLEELGGYEWSFEWQKWTKHIEWKWSQRSQVQSKQREVNLHIHQDTGWICCQYIVDARNLHEFKEGLYWFMEDKVLENYKMRRKYIHLRRSLFWKLDTGGILRRITLYMKLVLWLSHWLMAAVGDKILG